MRALQKRFRGVYQLVLLTDETPENAAFYRSLGLAPTEECGCRAFLKI